jgi:hypothetical protein
MGRFWGSLSGRSLSVDATPDETTGEQPVDPRHRRLACNWAFWTVAGGEVISALGDNAYYVAFAWLVLSISGSATILAVAMVCNVLPNGLLLLVGGAITDRWSPKRVMFCSHMLRGILVLGLCTLTITGSARVWQFCAIAAAFGIADAFFWPASSSILPFLVAKADLPRANAAGSGGEQVAMFLGPLLGGALLVAFSPSAVLAVDAATFFLAAITVMRAPAALRRPTDEWSARGFWSSVTEGLSHVRGAADLRPPRNRLGVDVGVQRAVQRGSSRVCSVQWSRIVRFRRPNRVLGLGQLLGAISAAITGLPHRWGYLIIGMALGEASVFALIGLVASLPLARCLLTALGFGASYSQNVAVPTWIQANTPPGMLGRTNSVVNLPQAALPPVSLALMGALAAVSTRFPFYFASLIMLVAAAIFARNAAARRLSIQN